MMGKKKSGIKSWPLDDRPREKLLKKGAGALSNSELLAILLRTGTAGTSAVELSRKILGKFGSFRSMAHTDTRDWKEFKSLGVAFSTVNRWFNGRTVPSKIEQYQIEKYLKKHRINNREEKWPYRSILTNCFMAV